MAKIVIDPQKSVWPFVYKVVAVGLSTNEYELPRNKTARKWVVNLTKHGNVMVIEHVEVDDSTLLQSEAFLVKAIHVKGGVVLKTPNDILEFLKS